MPVPYASEASPKFVKLGWAWLAFCTALALHVTDEALTGFLSVYNPTILAIRPAGWRFPPTFDFQTWLTGLILAVTVGFAGSLSHIRAPGPGFYSSPFLLLASGYLLLQLAASSAGKREKR